MKKTLMILLAIAFLATMAMSSIARTQSEEIQAIKTYIQGLDKSIAKAHSAGQNARENRLFAIKQAQLARLAAFNAPKVVAPAPVIAPPAAEVIKVYSTAEVGTGRGISVLLNGGLDAGLVGWAGNFDYALSNPPNQGTKIRIGVNYISGNNPTGNDTVKVLSAKLGACYYITPFMPSIGVPLTWYVGGAYLLPFKVYNDRTGKWGVEAYLGANYDVPEMGTVNFELGYGALKYAADQPALKGLDLKVGYGFVF